MVKMRSLLFLPYTTKFVRAKPQNYYSLTTTFAVAKPQNLLKPNHTNVRAHTTTFGGHQKFLRILILEPQPAMKGEGGKQNEKNADANERLLHRHRRSLLI